MSGPCFYGGVGSGRLWDLEGATWLAHRQSHMSGEVPADHLLKDLQEDGAEIKGEQFKDHCRPKKEVKEKKKTEVCP